MDDQSQNQINEFELATWLKKRKSDILSNNDLSIGEFISHAVT